MRITILTLFPQMVESIRHSIIGKAIEKGTVKVDVVDIRNFTKDKHRKCDDTPYGGGAGMLMTVQPIYDCINSVDPERKARRIYLSPVGSVFCDNKSRELAKCEDLILLCGHYEGVDQRAIDLCIDECISIGDYVLTGGELAAMVVVDSVCRFVGGVLGSELSHEDESFANGLLEYPQYTKPREFAGLSVPEVLTNGNHAQIKKWQIEQSIENTKKYRPELIK